MFRDVGSNCRARLMSCGKYLGAADDRNMLADWSKCHISHFDVVRRVKLIDRSTEKSFSKLSYLSLFVPLSFLFFFLFSFSVSFNLCRHHFNRRHQNSLKSSPASWNSSGADKTSSHVF